MAEDGNSTDHLVVTKGAFRMCSISAHRSSATASTSRSTTGGAELDATFESKGAEDFGSWLWRRAGCRASALQTRRRQAMTFAAFSLLDPPKPDAKRTIHDLAQLGIRIKVISETTAM